MVAADAPSSTSWVYPMSGKPLYSDGLYVMDQANDSVYADQPTVLMHNTTVITKDAVNPPSANMPHRKRGRALADEVSAPSSSPSLQHSSSNRRKLSRIPTSIARPKHHRIRAVAEEDSSDEGTYTDDDDDLSSVSNVSEYTGNDFSDNDSLVEIKDDHPDDGAATIFHCLLVDFATLCLEEANAETNGNEQTTKALHTDHLESRGPLEQSAREIVEGERLDPPTPVVEQDSPVNIFPYGNYKSKRENMTSETAAGWNPSAMVCGAVELAGGAAAALAETAFPGSTRNSTKSTPISCAPEYPFVNLFNGLVGTPKRCEHCQHVLGHDEPRIKLYHPENEHLSKIYFHPECAKMRADMHKQRKVLHGEFYANLHSSPSAPPTPAQRKRKTKRTKLQKMTKRLVPPRIRRLGRFFRRRGRKQDSATTESE